MISLSAIESCKILADVLSHMIPGGVAFCLIEEDTIIWSLKPETFKLDVFRVGQKVTAGRAAVQAAGRKKAVTYGKRLAIVPVPIFNDTDNSNSSASTAYPTLYPVAAAFGDFAPILSDMFPEGSFIYMSDLEKMAHGQTASKTDIPELTVGHIWTDTDITYKAIKLKQPVLAELDSLKYGIPVFVAAYPLADEEYYDGVVATLGIRAPKKNTFTPGDLAGNTERGLAGIPAAIIRKLTENIKEMVGEAENKSDNSLFPGQEQASATKKMTAGVREMMVMAEGLNKISKIV